MDYTELIKKHLPGDFKTLRELLESNISVEIKERVVKSCIEAALKSKI